MTNQKSLYRSLLILMTLLTGCQSISNEKNNYLVAAHRGFHTEVPENSIESIKRSIHHNIDIIEVDIRISEDGIPILMHDDTVDRTTNGVGEVTSLELEKLKELRLLHQGEPTNYTIPTLEEALITGMGKILFDLDLKTLQVEIIMDVVEKTGAHDSVIFFDSDWDVLDKVHKAHPDWKIMPRSYTIEEAKEAYERYKPWAVHVDPSFATPELSDYLRKKGAHVWINALGDVDRALDTGNVEPFEELLKTQSNIIQTDLPVTIKQKIEESMLLETH